MNKRIYNVLFHTHTVSGLVISVALFVIFFAGSISFFRDDIIAWERNEPIAQGSQMETDFGVLLDTISSRHFLHGKSITISQPHQEKDISVSISTSKDTTVMEDKRSGAFFYIDKENFEETDYYSGYTLGEFIYRLHFFAQIPYPYGYLLSGFVAFFFLFAIITGVIVHWNKIISNFYVFRPWAKLKTIWTDAHTALGLIGLPFQFMFAVTGAVLIIGTTVLLGVPGTMIYKGDQDRMYRHLMDHPAAFEYQYDTLSKTPDFGSMVTSAMKEWDDAMISRLVVENYSDGGMHVIVEGRPKTSAGFVGIGRVIFDHEGRIVQSTKLSDVNYIVGVDQTMRRLHFGNFGGYGLRIVYFVFGIISCFVIISGVLIWVEARDKKSNTDWKRKANRWVASIFLAICLTMYPVTALSFSVVKLFGFTYEATNYSFLFQWYFIPWLVLSVLFSLKRDNYFTNKYCLISGSALSLAIPFVNGAVSGNWMWKTLNPDQLQIFVVDAFWLVVAVVSLAIFFRLKRKV